MGLFTSNRQQRLNQSSPQVGSFHSNIYVLARSTPISGLFSSSTSPLSWSLCVEEPSNQGGLSLQYPQPKKSKSFFNIKRTSAHSTTTPNSNTQTTSSNVHFIEFSLRDGNLRISRPAPKILFNSSRHSDDTLLQILLPTTVNSAQTHQSLSTRLEQLFYQTTSLHSHLSNQDSDIWTRFILIALQQHGGILPQPPTFDVNDFMSFAQNQLTELEAEVLSSSHDDDESTISEQANNVRIKQVTYQSHVEERARLRKLVSQTNPSNDGDQQTTQFPTSISTTTNIKYNTDNQEGELGDETPEPTLGTNSSWWNNGPQIPRSETNRDQYTNKDAEVDMDEPRGFL